MQLLTVLLNSARKVDLTLLPHNLLHTFDTQDWRTDSLAPLCLSIVTIRPFDILASATAVHIKKPSYPCAWNCPCCRSSPHGRTFPELWENTAWQSGVMMGQLYGDPTATMDRYKGLGLLSK